MALRFETSLGPVACLAVGEGPPVVLLHANPGDRRDWDGIIPALAERHRVLAVDWPGYGDSPLTVVPERITALSLTAALGEILMQLDGPPPFLIGNSVGGFAAASVALSMPARVSGIVLANPGGFSQLRWLDRLFVRCKGTRWFTAMMAGRLARYYLRRRTPWTQAMIARADAERHEPERVAIDASVWRSFLDPAHDLKSRIGAISVPTLFVWGRHDPILPIERDGRFAQAALPSAPFVELDTGHATFAEDPDAFLAVVVPFLAEQRRQGAAA